MLQGAVVTAPAGVVGGSVVAVVTPTVAAAVVEAVDAVGVEVVGAVFVVVGSLADEVVAGAEASDVVPACALHAGGTGGASKKGKSQQGGQQ